MNRREALKVIATTGFAGLAGTAHAGSKQHLFTGWEYSATARRAFIRRNKYPFFSQLSHRIAGDSDGKIVMLNPFFEQALGRRSEPHDQGLGDCVSHAFALGIDYLTAVQVYKDKTPERWIAECATEPIYGGARVEIGEGVLWGDGATGFWAAEWLITYGALLRQKYPGFDFTKYDPAVAKEFGKDGCPDSLEPIAKLHPIKTASLVNDFDSLCDALANGYPCTLCSDVGFGMTSASWVRDSQGFLKRRGQWGHAMLAVGFDKKSTRKGACIVNSWGNWVKGPTQHGQPKGSFWCDKSTVDAILRQGDSHALSQYVGYPHVDIPDYTIW